MGYRRRPLYRRAGGGSVTNLQGDPLRYNKPELHNPPFVAAAEGVTQLWQELVP